MREIKFRFYDERNKEIICWEKIYKRGLHHYLSGTIENVTSMQYTGFKDKNGKEIYDGDILGDWVEVDGKIEQSKLQVYFDEKLGQWMLDNSLYQDKSYSYALFSELQNFNYEVIGNIYEKPIS